MNKKLLIPLFIVSASALAQGVFEKRIAPVSSDESRSFKKQVKVALLVGVAKYPDASGLSPLNYAASDAIDVGALLKQQGYLVTVLTDFEATRGAILRTLNRLGEAVDPEQGTFLFYYSGHGFALGGKNYLAPISASESDLDREGLAVDEIEQLIGKTKARRQLILMDACRNDASQGSKGAGGRSFSALQAAEGLRILNSTRVGRVSYESEDLKHGVFTAFVLDALRGGAAGTDGLVTFHDLLDYVTDGVRRWGVEHDKIQIPFESVGKDKEASGDFLLATAAAGAPTPTIPLPKPPPGVAPSPEQALIDTTPKQMETKVNPKDGLTYIWIPAGSFYMGCSPGDDECDQNENPSHSVSITRGFWLGQTPVTQRAWRQVMGHNPSYFKRDSLPVEEVTWDKAKQYCEAIGGRLPTEAEWEYAARAGTVGARYGALDSIAWYDGNSGSRTHDVGTKEPNNWKLYDMLGNVWQWTDDWFGQTYYSEGAKSDPQGPQYGMKRVLRGGSWYFGPRILRVSFRHESTPGYRNMSVGLRCVGA